MALVSKIWFILNCAKITNNFKNKLTDLTLYESTLDAGLSTPEDWRVVRVVLREPYPEVLPPPGETVFCRSANKASEKIINYINCINPSQQKKYQIHRKNIGYLQ